MEILDSKFCEGCGKVLERKKGETSGNYKKRKHCNRNCAANTEQRRKKRKRKAFNKEFGICPMVKGDILPFY